MDERKLRKAFSDVSLEIKRNIREKEEQEQEGEELEVKKVKCDCCGIEEECTVQYIDKVRNLYSGNWVCGLCAVVITERFRKDPLTAAGIQGALDWHKGICDDFNSTTRVNPKLDFARSMRDIAKRSNQKRMSSDFSLGSKISRTISCDPRLER
ncbi:uncharacterized protein LOC17889988 [Capsella rubella]|uniref:uncharacterized protein LOC17889988 n=1 Tax=Capsella rubella TaxID=81985 RepID=UPI000CD4D7C7|nr:uncharacterized protein LOC17889988 [Capsella rubella]